jgi:hypothetical protein
MSAHAAILPEALSRPNEADARLAAVIRGTIPTLAGPQHALTEQETAELIAAHRCRAEEAVWTTKTRAAA